jgi:hypothetical protein
MSPAIALSCPSLKAITMLPVSIARFSLGTLAQAMLKDFLASSLLSRAARTKLHHSNLLSAPLFTPHPL